MKEAFVRERSASCGAGCGQGEPHPWLCGGVVVTGGWAVWALTASPVWTWIAGVVLVLVLSGGGEPFWLERSGLWLRYRVSVLVRSALADVLHSARPGHLLRWAGFALLFAGFHLDLLAS
ncbi:hypothetical protein Nocox_21765 [Nonomuraea coxensis DSM 45129]|uniref:Uncharacterized protein n=1 Tax=Nonomuraea coxensis DSM 45129 TaxID=1122611 RepID=A0ABX8U2I5_9ACTN|nr:hypothetical protein [Nonomuraea coxensis]QYC41957.1 hypothetical protein Nocox_21765 [Nonomuraea coxensis DSM 45129]